MTSATGFVPAQRDKTLFCGQDAGRWPPHWPTLGCDNATTPHTRRHACLALCPYVPEGRQPKRQGLAAAGGSNANQVTATERNGQALRLDGGGLLEGAGGMQLMG